MKNLKKIGWSAVLLTALLGTTTAHAMDDAEFRSQFLSGSMDWSEVTKRAQDEGTVNFYYWGGSDIINLWIDQVAKPALAEEGVTLNPVRITATKDTVDVILAQLASGKGEGEGSVDMLWVNGENFFTLKQQGALWGSFADKLPNSVNFEWDNADPRAQLNLSDFGTATDRMEMPWSGEQYVCAVDRAHVSQEETPATFEDLKAYLEQNPGKFAYVKPPHYLGNTFVQSVLYAHNPEGTGAEPFQLSLEELGADKLATLIEPGFAYLKEIEPLLLGGPQGNPRYPEGPSELDNLFLNSEVHFNCKFGLYGVYAGLITGTYPETAEEMIFPAGNMIKNKSYLAIPLNSPNSAAALVAINYFSSVASQAAMMKQAGMPAGLDTWKLTEADQAIINEAAPPHYGVTQAEFDANIAPDTNASLVDVIEGTWLEVIERGSDKPIKDVVAEVVANLK
ncbi:ABC transporter substrate-binding protein [Pseudovibrio sp. SPO723]|uniref:ABC transporter substrate-binding protein n=1 Tax=Nesiotobacter zosterae TaxID=392721 RepID=UPI0029C3BEA5|nr:ABC transporter substrate-binding protein [Pseudovibrio sp. SPO723]MDX5592193.1 ABC transporter substrate-binding protein [Pseudovibrio sp. SPO723]